MDNTMDNTEASLRVTVNRVGTLQEVERTYIIQILEKTYWRVEGEGGAAQILGMNPHTLRSRMKKLGIHRPRIEVA